VQQADIRRSRSQLTIWAAVAILNRVFHWFETRGDRGLMVGLPSVSWDVFSVIISGNINNDLLIFEPVTYTGHLKRELHITELKQIKKFKQIRLFHCHNNSFFALFVCGQGEG